MTPARVALTTLAVGVMALVGCSHDSVAGTPVAGTPVTTPSGPSTSISGSGGSGRPLPPRPRELNLNGVNPCTLIPPDRRAEFGLNRPPLGPDQQGKTIGCSISSQTGGLVIYADTEHPASYFLGDTAASYGAAISIEGYGAVSGYPKVVKDSVCYVKVDVAEGQNLSIIYTDRTNQGPNVLCPLVQRIAGVALDTLKAQKK